MRFAEWVGKKIYRFLKLERTDGRQDEERSMLIGNKRAVTELKLAEYDVWYEGDSDEILNFYTQGAHYRFNIDPILLRNKKGYFWSISSTELDIKRTHSGQPRNIADTLVGIVGEPEYSVGMSSESVDSPSEIILRAILEYNDFWGMRTGEQMPMTLVEGWGSIRVDIDPELPYPTLVYSRAKDTFFMYRNGRLTGFIFNEDYVDADGNCYVIAETRTNTGDKLVIKKNVFSRIAETVTELDDEAVHKIPGLEDLNLDAIVFEGYKGFFAVPCVYFKDPVDNDGFGRSIFTGKIDLFDDLDQCLSQSSNTVRRSTTVEYFNTEYLERDPKTGTPIMPKVYDRKYTMVRGATNADGTALNNAPVTATQPNLQFNEYSVEAQNILCQIISGIMSPATLGIDVAKKDNADAQREKEKVTIFTRNMIINKDRRMLAKLFSEVLCAYEYMQKGIITVQKYDISIKYSEFADDSYENKLSKLGEAFIQGTISVDMFLDKLYGDTLSPQDRKRERDWLIKEKEKADDGGFDDKGVDDVEPEEEDNGTEFGTGDMLDLDNGKPGFKGVEPGE